ncbi:MAG: ethanolamine utilization protein EutJ [Propionibacterium sp.]|nr:ethanolamine utilization protein EutJ [Propionibacterium sp.]
MDPRGITRAEDSIRTFASQVRDGWCSDTRHGLRLGVDLGTANIVLAIIDGNNAPVAGSWRQSTVVRDGIVVDWAGAVQAVRELRADLEQRLGHRFASASVSIPPGQSAATRKIFTNVLEACGLQPEEVVDEPVAAARTLGVTDGAVIDIGHGTTGVSVLRGGQVVYSIDEPTGGHHIDLVLAGALGVSYARAEAHKKDPLHEAEVFGIVRPTLEKMATIAAAAIAGECVDVVYLVGGSSSFPAAPDVFAERLSLPVHHFAEPMFVTPLGVPMKASEGMP